MSSLAWIDFDEAERQRVQRIMELFQERETRDELGLGAIRDSIADHLFPGTSTIQTRLRYMLFIPWLFRSLEQRALSVAQLRTEARQLELDFIMALKRGNEKNGVFGSEAGGRLQRLPSSVYWAGLGAWGIRKFPGSIDGLFATLHGRPHARAAGNAEDEAVIGRVPAIWSDTLPDKPKGFPDTAVFRLSREEAQFIIDRLIATQPAALLTFLARRAIVADCDFIWSHPRLSEFPVASRHLVGHCEIFSSVMQGAALLYNLALSELRNSNELIEEHRGRLRAWRDELDLTATRDWSLDDFWQAAAHPAHRIPEPAKRFVAAWRELAVETQGDVASSAAARQLVEQRERRLKTGQSRYANHAVRDRWGGRSGVERLGFRWNQAKSHLRDLAHAE